MNKTKFVDTVQLPDFIVAFLLFVISMVVRLYACPSFALSTDESFTANISSSNFSEISRLIWSEGSPPLFYFLVKLWSLPFGEEDQSLKIFALVLSSLIPPAAYLSTIGITGMRRFAIVACMLSLFSPALIRFGNMLRPYSLICILSLLSTWSFFSLFQEKRNKRQYVLYCLVTIANLYSHLWTVVVFMSHCILALVQFLNKNWSKDSVFRFAKAVAVCVLAFLPWVFVVLSQTGKNLCPWYQAPSLFEFLLTMPLKLMTYTVGPKDGSIPFYVFVLFACTVFYFSIFFNLEPEKKGNLTYSGWLCALIYFISCFLAVAGIPSRGRYLLFLAVLVFILFANLLDRIFAWVRNEFVFALIPLCAFSILWFNQLHVLHRMPEAALGPLLVSLTSNKTIKDTDMVLVAYDTFVPEVCRKIKREQILAFPFVEPFMTIAWKDEVSAMKDRKNMNLLLSKAKTYLDGGKRVWLVTLAPARVTAKENETLDPYRKLQLKSQADIICWMNQNAKP